jgi:hypothetical protein
MFGIYLTCLCRLLRPVVRRTTRSCMWPRWIVILISGTSWHTITVNFIPPAPFEHRSNLHRPFSRLLGFCRWAPSQHPWWTNQWRRGRKVLPQQRRLSPQTHPRHPPLRPFLHEHRWSRQALLGCRTRLMGKRRVRLPCPSTPRLLPVPRRKDDGELVLRLRKEGDDLV